MSSGRPMTEPNGHPINFDGNAMAPTCARQRSLLANPFDEHSLPRTTHGFLRKPPGMEPTGRLDGILPTGNTMAPLHHNPRARQHTHTHTLSLSLSLRRTARILFLPQLMLAQMLLLGRGIATPTLTQTIGLDKTLAIIGSPSLRADFPSKCKGASERRESCGLKRGSTIQHTNQNWPEPIVSSAPGYLNK